MQRRRSAWWNMALNNPVKLYKSNKKCIRIIDGATFQEMQLWLCGLLVKQRFNMQKI